MLYLREFDNKEVKISFSKKVTETENTVITPVFRLKMHEVNPEYTVFSFITKAQTILASDASKLVSLFENTGIRIEVRKTLDTQDGTDTKYEWANTFPKLIPSENKFVAAGRDLVLCMEFFKAINDQYEKDIKKVDEALFEEFENFQ